MKSTTMRLFVVTGREPKFLRDFTRKRVTQKVTRAAISKARILRFTWLAVAEGDDLVYPAGFDRRVLVVCAYSGQVQDK